MPKHSNPLVSFLFIIASVAILAWGILIQMGPHESSLATYLFNVSGGVIYFLVGLLSFLSSTKTKDYPLFSRAMLLTSLGHFSWAAASWIWGFSNIILGVESPYPSVADVFFIGYSVLFALGFLLMIDNFRKPITILQAQEPILIMIATYLAVFFVLSPASLEQDPSPWVNFFNFIYPMSDAFIFSLALISFRMSSGKLSRGLLLLMLALILQAIADFIFSHRQLVGTYWNGDISDFFFILSGFVSGLGILQLSPSQLTVSRNSFRK